MNNFTDPMSWAVPVWHPDHGDVNAEFYDLRELATNVVQALPKLSVGLSAPEAGVMFLQVTADNGEVVAEVYSLPSDVETGQRKYGVFLYPDKSTEEEHYTPSIRSVLELLSQF